MLSYGSLRPPARWFRLGSGCVVMCDVPLEARRRVLQARKAKKLTQQANDRAVSKRGCVCPCHQPPPVYDPSAHQGRKCYCRTVVRR